MLINILTLTNYLQTVEPGRFNDYLLLAYGVMWLVVLVYIVSLANKQRNLQQEIQLMRRLLEEDEQRPGT